MLLGLYIFCIVTTELMGIKTFPIVQFSWLHLNASVAILLFPIIFTINDVVTEVHGKQRAKDMAKIGLMSVAMTFIFAWVATSLPPSTRFFGTESAYDSVFKSALRISGASIIAFAIAQATDILVFTKIRQSLGKKSLWFRNNISNFIGQLLDTSIFISLAFFSFSKPFSDNISFLVGLIIPYWLLKCVMSVVETPLVYAGVKWLKSSKE